MDVSILHKLVKTAPSKALVVRFNLFCLSIFLIVYATLLLRPSSSIYFENAASLVRCSLRECHHKVRWAYSNGIPFSSSSYSFLVLSLVIYHSLFKFCSIIMLPNMEYILCMFILFIKCILNIWIIVVYLCDLQTCRKKIA